MNAARAAGIATALALAAVASNAHALWLDIRAKGEMRQFYDQGNLLGFGASDVNDATPVLGRQANLRIIIDLDRAPAGNGVFLPDLEQYLSGFGDPEWMTFSGRIAGHSMHGYELPGGDPYFAGYAVIADSAAGREIGDYGLDRGLRNQCANDPSCSGDYETYDAMAVQVGSTGLNFLSGVALGQEYRWTGGGIDDYGDAEFVFNKKTRHCVDGQCFLTVEEAAGKFNIRSFSVQPRAHPVPEPWGATLFAIALFFLLPYALIRRARSS